MLAEMTKSKVVISIGHFWLFLNCQFEQFQCFWNSAFFVHFSGLFKAVKFKRENWICAKVLNSLFLDFLFQTATYRFSSYLEQIIFFRGMLFFMPSGQWDLLLLIFSATVVLTLIAMMVISLLFLSLFIAVIWFDFGQVELLQLRSMLWLFNWILPKRKLIFLFGVAFIKVFIFIFEKLWSFIDLFESLMVVTEG